jgi:hypothetical protein
VATTFAEIVPGSSGGGIYRIEDDAPQAVGVWSFIESDPETGAFLGSFMQRITPWFRDVITLERAALRLEDETDLTPLRLRASTQLLIPQLDGAVDDVEFVLYNEGGASFSGQVDAHFYLLPRNWTLYSTWDEEYADGPDLDEVGLYLGTHTFDASLDSQEGMVVEVADGTVTIPADWMTWEYVGSGETLFHMGVVLDVDDDQPYNNGGNLDDAGFFDRAELTLQQTQPDLAFGEITHTETDVEQGTPGPLSISLEVVNLGNGVADPWNVKFYLSDLGHLPPDADIELIPLGSGTAAAILPGDGLLTACSFPSRTAQRCWYLYMEVWTPGDSNGFNNGFFSSEPLLISDAPGGFMAAPPDLDITMLTTGTGTYAGTDDLPVTITVANDGGSSAQDWSVAFYAVRDPLTLSSPVYLGLFGGAQAISAGGFKA